MLSKWDNFFLYRKKEILSKIYQMVQWLSGITYTCAFLFVLTVIYEYGFRVSIDEASVIRWFTNGVWVMFLLHASCKLLIGDENEGKSRKSAWSVFLVVLLYLTLLPVVFKLPEEDSGVQWIWLFFHSSYYRMVVLLLLSVSQLSGGLVRLLGKRTNPSIILASSFLVFIFIGSGLLMLPEATVNGIHWIDALFTATSATCVTGLSTVDITQVFTQKGQIIILLLIQIGGLGVMTLTSFFAMFFMGKTSLYNQLVVGDMISSESLNSLLSTLLYILGFTLAIEGIGVAVIWFSIHGTVGMTADEELYFSIFHAVSAFCNAGFSTLQGNLGNPLVMQHHNLLFLTISFLVILGGIGFPILVNLYKIVVYYLKWLKWLVLRKKGKFPRQVHLYNLNTKIVLVMTGLLLVAGTVLIVIFEWNVSLEGMTWTDKWVHAFFNAVCPRTAGFNSVAFTTMSVQTILLMILLMIVGGGTQSTAGGVKINVVAVIAVNMWSVIRGAECTTVFKRQLSVDSIRRSNAALMLYMVMLIIGVFLLTLFEPHASVKQVVFECISALSTVGSSLDFTPKLSIPGKVLIILLMFIGRVGAFTLATGLIKQTRKQKYRYPSDNIIIN